MLTSSVSHPKIEQKTVSIASLANNKINGRYTYRESELSFPNGKLQAQQYQSMNDSKAKSPWFTQHNEQR